MKMRYRLTALAAAAVVLMLLAACPAPVGTTGPVDPVTPPAAAPTGLIVTGRTTSTITLGWNAVTGASSYTVLQSDSFAGTYTAVATGVTATSRTVTGLSADTTYYFAVYGQNNGGAGPVCTAISGTTEAAVPAYSEGYNAFIADYNESMNDLNTAMGAAPPAFPGTTTYTVNGANGGIATLIYTTAFTTTIEFTENYGWNNYRGTHGSTINGTWILDYDLGTGGSVTGTIAFVYGVENGSVTYDCTIDSSLVLSGTYTVTYLGESHTYDVVTGLEI